VNRGKIISRIALLLILFLITCFDLSVFAGEEGHYSPAPMGVRDNVLPPKGTYFVSLNTFYNSDTFIHLKLIHHRRTQQVSV